MKKALKTDIIKTLLSDWYERWKEHVRSVEKWTHKPDRYVKRYPEEIRIVADRLPPLAISQLHEKGFEIEWISMADYDIDHFQIGIIERKLQRRCDSEK